MKWFGGIKVVCTSSPHHHTFAPWPALLAFHSFLRCIAKKVLDQRSKKEDSATGGCVPRRGKEDASQMSCN